MLRLRDYQEEAVAAVLAEARQGVRRQLVVLPTGAGKTAVAAALSARAHGRVLFLCHRDELVQQAVEKFSWVWPEGDVGVVKAERDEHDRRVVVASVQTLQHERRRERLGAFTLVIVDEAHHAVSPSQVEILSSLGLLPETPPGRLLLGLTATPFRGDKVGLGHVFERIVYRKSIADLIRAGYLADVKGVRVSTRVDLSRVKVRHGDFQAKDLSLAVDTPRRNALIVEAYRRHGEGRKAVVFAVDVAHARHLAEAFRAAGFRADWVSGELPAEERRERLKKFRDGETDVLTNCQILTEGYDEPSIGCLVMARPTRSKALYIQAVGRGLRLYPGKDYCVVIDVADNAHDLVTVATLAAEGDLPAPARRTASGPSEAAEVKDEPGETAAADIVAEPVDLLARSKFRWRVERHRMVLEAGPGQEIVLEEAGPDRWTVTLHARRGRTPLSPQALPLAYAQGVAEDWVRENETESYAARDARWRSRPPTPRQAELLAKLGVALPPGATREQATDLIRDALRRRALEDPEAPWRREPASPRQIAWMERHGFPVPPGFTKGDFSDLLERLKRSRSRA